MKIELRGRFDTRQMTAYLQIDVRKPSPFQGVVMLVQFDFFAELSLEPLRKLKVILILSLD